MNIMVRFLSEIAKSVLPTLKWAYYHKWESTYQGLYIYVETLHLFRNSIWGLTNNLLVKWGATGCVEDVQFFPSILLVFVVR